MPDIVRQLNPILGTPNLKVVEYFASLIPDGGTSVSRNAGKGFTASRVSAGLYRIAFVQPFNDVLVVLPSLQLATKDTWFAQAAGYSVANRTVDVRIIDEANALVDPTTTDKIYIYVAVTTSALPK